MALVAVAIPLVSQADGLRFPFVGTLQVAGRPILPILLPPPASGPPLANPEYAPYAARCGGAPVLVTEGAGNTSLLGLVTDFQSHCLGNPDANGKPTFFNGEFTFTDTNGRFLTGAYFGTLKPTVTSQPPPGPNAPPSGTWIIEGNVCFSGASPQLHIADDCAAHRFFPARGVTDPSTGLATLYFNQTLGFR
jgi:hypothetical protein